MSSHSFLHKWKSKAAEEFSQRKAQQHSYDLELELHWTPAFRQEHNSVLGVIKVALTLWQLPWALKTHVRLSDKP